MDEDMPLADRTFAELMSYVKDKDIDDAKDEDLPNFMQLWRKWCQKEGSYVLGKKGLQFKKMEGKNAFGLHLMLLLLWFGQGATGSM